MTREIERVNRSRQATGPVLTSGPQAAQQAGNQVIRTIRREQFSIQARSSIIPEPEELGRYNDVVTNGADRIFKMTEETLEHQRWMARTYLLTSSKRAEKGLNIGGVIVLTALIVTLLLGLNGQPWLGGAVGVSGLTYLAAVFVYGSNNQKIERIEKAKIMSGEEPPEVQPKK